MPARTFQNIATYNNASQLPDDLWNILEIHARNANVILPQALKSRAAEQSGNPIPQRQVWITYTSYNPHATIEFVLSCAEGYMGSYPAFIVTTLPFKDLTDDSLRPRLHQLAVALKDAMPVERVYSVFAPEPITRLFTELWTALTGIKSDMDKPYYAANITYCTRDSFINKQQMMHPLHIYELRPAVPEDINEIAQLCYWFAADSHPFCLTLERARDEAVSLVHNNQVWVHRVRCKDQNRDEIASIVCFTRNSESVATISKVFTNPSWRRLGCAERLVRRVCRHLLLTKESVVLYVAHDNQGAAKVYHRVGFCGLAKNSPAVEGVDPWLEIGLDLSKVRLGHW